MRPTAIVLAAGIDAVRVGQAEADLRGRPLLAYALEAVALVAGDVILAIAPDAPVPTLSAGLASQIRVTRDAGAHAGPLAGLGTALDAVPHDADSVIVVGGDMPELVPAVLSALVDALAADERLGVVMLASDPPAPLPMALRPWVAVPALHELPGGWPPGAARPVGAVPAAVVPAARWRALDPDGRTLRDVDTPADLGRA